MTKQANWKEINEAAVSLIHQIVTGIEDNSKLDRRAKEYAKHRLAAAMKVCERETGRNPRSLKGIYRRIHQDDGSHPN